MILHETLVPGCTMLMCPNQDKTAVHGCHYRSDMVVCMRKVMAISRGWCSVSVVPFSYSSYFYLLRSTSLVQVPITDGLMSCPIF